MHCKPKRLTTTKIFQFAEIAHRGVDYHACLSCYVSCYFCSILIPSKPANTRVPYTLTSQPSESSILKILNRPCHSGKATGILSTSHVGIRDSTKKKTLGHTSRAQKKLLINRIDSAHKFDSLICLNDLINPFPVNVHVVQNTTEGMEPGIVTSGENVFQSTTCYYK